MTPEILLKLLVFDDDEFIMVDVCKNTSFIVEGNYRNKL